MSTPALPDNKEHPLWDEHEHDHPHEHFIVPWQTLLGVLVTLLILTMLTVNVAQFERFAASEWGWSFPGWSNIVIALAIAGVKGTLVVMYFMQLRWDKGLNVVLFLFTLFAVMLFLMFTAIDLTGRGHNVEWRAGQIVEGGTGYGIKQGESTLPAGTSIFAAAKTNYQAEKELTTEEWEAELAHHKHGHGDHDKTQAVTRLGLTPGLFAVDLWAVEDDHHGHGEDHDGDHADEEHGGGH